MDNTEWHHLEGIGLYFGHSFEDKIDTFLLKRFEKFDGNFSAGRSLDKLTAKPINGHKIFLEMKESCTYIKHGKHYFFKSSDIEKRVDNIEVEFVATIKNIMTIDDKHLDSILEKCKKKLNYSVIRQYSKPKYNFKYKDLVDFLNDDPMIDRLIMDSYDYLGEIKLEDCRIEIMADPEVWSNRKWQDGHIILHKFGLDGKLIDTCTVYYGVGSGDSELDEIISSKSGSLYHFDKY